jgi:hypothetical protein
VPPASTGFHDSEFSRVFGHDAPPRGVLHIVGRLTEAVFHMLGPTCAALRAEGRPQAVLLIDDATGRRLVETLDPAIAIHFVEDAGNPVQRWFRMGRRVQGMVNAGRWEAVHLHGLMPLLVWCGCSGPTKISGMMLNGTMPPRKALPYLPRSSTAGPPST